MDFGESAGTTCVDAGIASAKHGSSGKVSEGVTQLWRQRRHLRTKKISDREPEPRPAWVEPSRKLLGIQHCQQYNLR